jgi:anthranilate/para-aminobenzoate synthase component I
VTELRLALDGFSSEPRADDGMPHGGLFGWVGFDGRFCFGLFPHVLIFAHQTEQWFERGGLSRHLASAGPPGAAAPRIDFRPVLERAQFLEMVSRALDYIAAGDIYQVNLSQPFVSAWPRGADAFPYYECVRHFSPMPHGAFLDLGGRQVISASPELFLRMSGRLIETRPIKGTRPRRREAQDDERSAYDLITSRKEIAELVMITDLERNDLGQVCEFGSVTVPKLLKLERFAQVFHLVSTVRGVLRGDVDHPAAFAACFPGGSISGAPKKRALEIIAELESHPRGLYTGAIGYFGAGGESQFSIAIRTAVAEDARLHFHAGAGIVADSDPGREYEETWDKATSLIGAVEWPRKEDGRAARRAISEGHATAGPR